MAWTQKTRSSPSGSEKRAAGRGGNSSPVRARNNKQKARRATAAKATPKAKQPNQNNNQRANLPSEVAKQYAQPARTRPAVSIVSTAKTSAAPSAKIANSPMPISAAENAQIDTAFAAKSTPKIKTTMGKETSGYGVNNSILGATGTNMMASLNSTNPLKVSPASTQSKSADNGSVPSYSQGNGAMSAASSPLKQAKPLLSVEPTNLPARPQFGPLEQGVIPLAGTVAEAQAGQLELLQNLQANPLVRPNFNKDSYDQEALVGKDSLIRGDKYRNDEVSYNQAYYKARRAGGATQAELAAEQKSIGSKKMYSGDRVISEADQDRAKYTLQSLRRSGIDPTVTSEKSGFFDEMTTTKSSYDIGTGKSVTSTVQDYKPNILGFQLGDNVTKTFVNGVATYTKRGDGERTTSELGSLKQRSQSGPDAAKELSNIDNQIKTETDPVKLRALHKRRLMLMRMNRTNTKFAGLLGEADTKRTNLMSIS